MNKTEARLKLQGCRRIIDQGYDGERQVRVALAEQVGAQLKCLPCWHEYLDDESYTELTEWAPARALEGCNYHQLPRALSEATRMFVEVLKAHLEVTR